MVRGLLPVKTDFALNLLIEVRNEQRLRRPRVHIPAPSYGTRRHGWADAIHLRAYEGKKVRISGALESPHVIVVRTFDAVD